MPEPIGEIPVQITGDYSGLEKDLQQAESIASKSAGEIAGAFNSGSMAGLQGFGDNVKEFVEAPLSSAQSAVGSFLESFGGIGLVAVGAATAIGAVTAAIGDLVLEEGAAAESTQNMADRLGLTFNETKQLQEVADVAGVSIDTLGRASVRLATALEDESGAGEKVRSALDSIGVTAQTSGEALLQVLQKLAEIPDTTERIAKAHEILGRSAIQLEPVLKNYESINEAVTALGGRLDADLIKGLLAADDAADHLGHAWGHLKEELAATFAPAVTEGLNLLTSFLAGPPKGDLDAQLARLSSEINKLEADANSASSSFERMFQTFLGLKPNDAVLQEKKQLLDVMEAQRDAINRSKEYNDELDKSNRFNQAYAVQLAKTREEHEKEAAALAKEAEAAAKAADKYRVLFLSFDSYSSKVRDAQAIKFERSLFPPEWFKEEKEALIALEKVRAAMNFDQDARQAASAIALIKGEFQNIIDLGTAFKALGKDASSAIQDNLTQSLKNFHALQQSTLATTHDLDASWNKVLQAQLAAGQAGIRTLTDRLNLEIQLSELTGKDATAQIIQLEQIRQSQQILFDQATALGTAYIELRRAFNDAFTTLEKGLTDATISGKNLGDVFINVGKQIASSILDTIIKGALTPLQHELNKTGELFDTIATKITGSLGHITDAAKGAAAAVKDVTSGSGEVLKESAGLPGGVTQGVGQGSGEGGAATPSSAGGAAASSLTSVVGAIAGVATAISSIVGNFQMSHMNKLLGEIEVSTRGQLNQLISIQGTLNTYLPELLHLVDIWRQLQILGDTIALAGAVGNGGGGNEGGGLGTNVSLNDLIALVNTSVSSQIDSVLAASGVQQTSGGGFVIPGGGNEFALDQPNAAANQAYADSVQQVTQANLDAAQQLHGAIPPAMDAIAAATEKAVTTANLAGSFDLGSAVLGSQLVPHTSFAQATGISPSGGGGQTTGVAVTVNAVDPSGRQITQATVKGLEEVGIRVR